MAIGLDYTSRITPAALGAAGVTVVCRYIAPQAWKAISKAEYDELLANHFTVFLNWESSGTDWLRGGSGGLADGAAAAKMARALGYPDSSIIIGSCDFDISQAQADAVGNDYATAFKRALSNGGYRAGVYGPKRALDIGQRLGYAFGWQTMSIGWYGTVPLHPFANLRQIAFRTVGGVQGDWNQIIRLDTPVTNGGPFMALSDQQQQDMSEWLALLVDPNTPATGRPTDRFRFPPTLFQIKAQVAAISAKVDALSVPVGFTDTQVAAMASAIETALIANNANGLTPTDHADIQTDLQVSLAAELRKLGAAA